jgi:hypothetical protein
VVRVAAKAQHRRHSGRVRVRQHAGGRDDHRQVIPGRADAAEDVGAPVRLVDVDPLVGDRVAVQEGAQRQRRTGLTGADDLDGGTRDDAGDVPAPPGNQGPQQDVGDIGLAGQDLTDLGRGQGHDPAVGGGPGGEERTLAGQHVQLAGELARPMVGQFHAAAQRVVAHDYFAAQHHEQIGAVVGGRVQDLTGRDPTRRAVPAQPGLLAVVQHRVGGGLAGQTGH